MTQQSPAGKSGPRCPLIPSLSVSTVATIEVYVDSKDGRDNAVKLQLGELSPDATRDEIRRRWGGGHFELHAQPQRGTETLAVVSLSLAGEPLWQSEDPSNDGFDGMPPDPRAPQAVFAIPAEGGVVAGLPPKETQEIIEKTQAKRDERADQSTMMHMFERQSQTQMTLMMEMFRGVTAARNPTSSVDPAQAMVVNQQINMLNSQINDMHARYQRELSEWGSQRMEMQRQLNALSIENHNLHRDLSDAQAQLKWLATAGAGGENGKGNMLQSVLQLAATPAGQGIISGLAKGIIPGGGAPPGMIPPVAPPG